MDVTEPRFKKAFAIIHGYEGLGGKNPEDGKYYPYQGDADAKGVITIGRGHVLSVVEKATKKYAKGLTLAECDALFLKDITPRIQRLEKVMGHWTDDQFAAALSMFYNIEVAWTPGRSPYEHHRHKNYAGCAKWMLRYIYDGRGRKCLGLWRRRMSEALCYMTGQVIVAKDSTTEAWLEAQLRKVVSGIGRPTGMV